MSVIVIDPGHGGAETIGGSSPNNATGPHGTLEKTITLALGTALFQLLQGRGHKVWLTRDGDTNLGLKARAAVAKKKQAAVFLSIHCNGFGDSRVNGTETLLHPRHSESSLRLAELIQKAVLKVTALRDRGVKPQSLGVLTPESHHPTTAACLLEVSFLTNPQEETRLNDAAYRQRLVDAMAQAIEAFVTIRAVEVPMVEAAKTMEGLELPAATPEAPSTRLSDMRTLEELGEPDGEEAFRSDAITPLASLANRNGFDTGFLTRLPVPLPIPGKQWQKDLAPVKGGGVELKYQNFSIVMSKSRRLALITACNIDGSKSQSIPRTRDSWRLDPRIDSAHQAGEFLYADNDLDRGHLVRREDPNWGAQAKLANTDTFHFTNCSPQHAQMNQKTWLGLENYILQNARVEKLRVNVFTGPVFGSNDPVYRGIQIPRQYWKVVALFSEGRPSATAYLLSQGDLIENLEFVYGAYKTYQVSIRQIEELTGLDFGALRRHDGFSGEEAVRGQPMRAEIAHWRSIRI